MSFPKQSEIELPLLKLLHEFGGKAQPKEVYAKIAELFPAAERARLICAASKQPIDVSMAQPRSVESTEARRKG